MLQLHCLTIRHYWLLRNTSVRTKINDLNFEATGTAKWVYLGGTMGHQKLQLWHVSYVALNV